MWRKISIIAVIAGLDLAFIFLMGGGLDLDEVSRASDPLPPAQPYFVLRPLPSESSESDVEAAESENADHYLARIHPRKRFEIEPQVQRSEKVRSYRRVPERRSLEIETQANFTDTVIYVKTEGRILKDAPQSLQTPQQYSESKNSSKLEPRKRSFISRTLPIVKKPYEWIKDLVSKLRS